MVERPNVKLYKIELYLLKIIPMLLAGIHLTNTVLSYYGIDIIIFSYIGSVSLIPLIFLYISSYVFKFCEYHRMFLHYIVVNNLINIYDYYIGIPIDAKELFITHLIIAGICLIVILYLYVKTNKKTIIKTNR
jgi:hypothetical protein